MKSNQTTKIDSYVREFQLELARYLKRDVSFRVQEADDFKQYCTVWLLEHISLMEKYAPRALVSACAHQRKIDFFRKMGRQLPQGKYEPATGQVTNALQWLEEPLSASGAKASLIQIPSPTDFESDVLNNMLMAAMLTSLTQRQQQVFLLVDVDGYNVVQAAQKMGVRREMAQRELGKARKVVAILRSDYDY